MGFVVRSRFSQNLEEEKASLYHAAKEINSKKNNIDSLKINGHVSVDSVQIENEVLRFFNALLNGHHDSDMLDTGSPFVPDNTHLQDILNDLSSLDGTERDKLEEDVDIAELDAIILECPNNKAPGLDGISYEFYKVTWSIIRKTMVMVLQCQLDRSSLIDSNTCGATRLLSKMAGVPNVEELRPY